MRVTAAELWDCLERLPLLSEVEGPIVRVIVREPVRVVQKHDLDPALTPTRALTFRKQEFREKGRKPWTEWALEVSP